MRLAPVGDHDVALDGLAGFLKPVHWHGWLPPVFGDSEEQRQAKLRKAVRKGERLVFGRDDPEPVTRSSVMPRYAV